MALESGGAGGKGNCGGMKSFLYMAGCMFIFFLIRY